MTVTETASVAGTHDPNLLLQVENVDKSFPGIKAREGMRFDLRKGEVLGLVGENGAGKSTLMKPSVPDCRGAARGAEQQLQIANEGV
jgi:ABC-type phosphonate transport system ATPase subunit